MAETSDAKPSLFAGIVAGVAGSVCCVGPLVLLMLGVSGTWISSLTALEPYQPLFFGLTLVFLGLAFRKLYLVAPTCDIDKPCAKPETQRRQRIIFWSVSIVLLTMLTFPWYAHLFY